MKDFLKALEVQRWDDHRYYHHSRINQSLHLVSALCFIAAYGLLFVDPATSALLAWSVSMTLESGTRARLRPSSKRRAPTGQGRCHDRH